MGNRTSGLCAKSYSYVKPTPGACVDLKLGLTYFLRPCSSAPWRKYRSFILAHYSTGLCVAAQILVS